ncbi:hypothetical protein EAE96_010602 [Botrytis aclada]|nr:hypothetical protein EAE96_010602 [Botrytis aclada]
MAGGTTDEQAKLEELHNDVLPEVPLSNDDEMPDTPNSSSTNGLPNKDHNCSDTQKVKRYTCPSCKNTYINTRESMSHIAPVDMEQEEVLKCPHCEVPSIRETLKFTEETIEEGARPRRSYIPIPTGKKRFLCPHCKRASNTTLEAMFTRIPEVTEQGEVRTCLYCKKPSLKATLESRSDEVLRESPRILIQPYNNNSSNSNIQPSHQPFSPDQASTGTPSSQILEGPIHTPGSQNSPDQQLAYQPFLNHLSAIQSTTNQYTAFQSSSNENPASDSNSHQPPAFQSNLYQQPISLPISLPTLHQQQPAFQTALDPRSAIQSTINQYTAFRSSSDEEPGSHSNSHQPPTFQSNLYQQQQPVVYPNPGPQLAFQITLDQRSALQKSTNQYPNFQTAFDQQSAFQLDPNRQSNPQFSFNQQSTFSPTHYDQSAFQFNPYQQPITRPTLHQQPAFQSNPFQQSIARPTIHQQQPAVHSYANQQSISGPNTDQQLASNHSSERDPLESFICVHCKQGFYTHRSFSSHRKTTCESRVWYFCPEQSCCWHRDQNIGLATLEIWREHLLTRHDYPIHSSIFSTYGGEVRDRSGATRWRAL